MEQLWNISRMYSPQNAVPIDLFLVVSWMLILVGAYIIVLV